MAAAGGRPGGWHRRVRQALRIFLLSHPQFYGCKQKIILLRTMRRGDASDKDNFRRNVPLTALAGAGIGIADGFRMEAAVRLQ